MQVIGLISNDDFLIDQNISIATDDFIEILRDFQVTTMIMDYSDPRVVRNHFTLDYDKKENVKLIEILSKTGFCYTFNIINVTDLFNLER